MKARLKRERDQIGITPHVCMVPGFDGAKNILQLLLNVLQTEKKKSTSRGAVYKQLESV